MPPRIAARLPTHVTGFADTVYQALERFEGQSGIRTMLVAGVEEALQNVRRHSSAGSVEITLERVGDDAVLTIRDDGRGLQGLPDGQGYGISGMHEYAVLAGCCLQIEGCPDRGTAVKVSLPLEGIA